METLKDFNQVSDMIMSVYRRILKIHIECKAEKLLLRSYYNSNENRLGSKSNCRNKEKIYLRDIESKK